MESQKVCSIFDIQKNKMKIKNNHEDIRANKKENVRYIEQVKIWENDREKLYNTYYRKHMTEDIDNKTIAVWNIKWKSK